LRKAIRFGVTTLMNRHLASNAVAPMLYGGGDAVGENDGRKDDPQCESNYEANHRFSQSNPPSHAALV